MAEPAADPERAIAATLRRLRQLRGLTADELGEAAGVTGQQVTKYERGEDRVAAATILAFARRLEVPIEVMFEGLDGIDPALGPHQIARLQRAAGALADIPEPLRGQMIGIIEGLRAIARHFPAERAPA